MRPPPNRRRVLRLLRGADLTVPILDDVPQTDPELGHPSYAERDVRAIPRAEVVEFEGGDLGLLVLVTRQDGLWIDFALLAWCGTDDAGVRHYQRVLRGEGAGPPLRELRHTYWGDPDNGGYLFYANRRLIAEAMAVLGRWFD